MPTTTDTSNQNQGKFRKYVLLILHMLVLAASIALIAIISIDTFQNQ